MKLNSKAEVLHLNTKKPATHLVIAAHQDDVEIMCGGGIVECFGAKDKGLVAVITADGAGSPRSGKYASYTDEQMKVVRHKEQIAAATMGDYVDLVMLNYSSAEIKDRKGATVSGDFEAILREYRPRVVYTHNPADKHPTHVGVVVNVIKALRALPKEMRPEKVYGLEVWRDLDWLPDSQKVVFDLSGQEELLRKLIAVHDSQIAGGKRYDDAVMGRRFSNATFGGSHSVDTMTAATYGMDLTELIKNDEIKMLDFVIDKIEAFRKEILV